MVDAEPTYFPLKSHAHEPADSVSEAAAAAAAAAASVVVSSESSGHETGHSDLEEHTKLRVREEAEKDDEQKPKPNGDLADTSMPDTTSEPEKKDANGTAKPSPAAKPVLANHSGVAVVELDVDGVEIMRRIADGALNATQILKLAGLDKAKRTRIIERELSHGGEKVQGGYGKFQGTWISFDRGLALCREHGVADVLAPLLEYDVGSAATGMESLAAGLDTGMESRNASRVDTGLDSSVNTTGLDTGLDTGMDTRMDTGLDAGMDSRIDAGMDSRVENGMDTTGVENSQLDAAGSAPEKPPADSNHNDHTVGTRALPPLEPSPGPEGFDAFERNRDIVTELFLNESRALGDILAKHRGEDIRVDVPIDDHGHTALHWASSLGRIDLVRDLVNIGADYARGNYAGESPLVRAVLVTNNSDLSSFGDLLDILYPCMHLADNSGRTVLHHIALTAGIKGRSDASRYYLETVLEWVVRNDPHSQLGVNWLIEELVNAQDHNGDTALNIAARIGNTQIARQLIDVGASVSIPNRAGLRPVDFGVLSPAPTADPRATLAATLSAKAAAAAAASVTATKGPLAQPPTLQSSAADKRKQVLDKLQETIADVETSFESELAAKNDLFASVHEQLNEATHTLNNYLGQQKRFKSLLESLEEQRARVEALSSAIHAEDQRFRSESSGGADTAQETDVLSLNGIDADEPFRVHSTSPAGLEALPPILLKARIAAYELNEAQLKRLRDDLQSSSLERERKYRRVVSQCTGVEESKVDGLLSSLVQAVESDMNGAGNPLDLSRVAGLLETVRR